MTDTKVEESVGKYRSRIEIVSLILGILSKGPATKTRLMYGAYLSYTQSNNYLDYLLSRGLIATEQRGGQPVYCLTERGLRVLQVSETMSDLLQPPPERSQSGSGTNDRLARQQTTPSDRTVENKKAFAQA